jgi:hypothetical protein
MEHLDLVKEPREIFREILRSKEKGTVIGISSPVLGRVTYLTGVEDIVVDETCNVYVVLKPYDTSGYMFPVRNVSLEKIHSVKPFSSKFENVWIEKKSGL